MIVLNHCDFHCSDLNERCIDIMTFDIKRLAKYIAKICTIKGKNVGSTEIFYLDY